MMRFIKKSLWLGLALLPALSGQAIAAAQDDAASIARGRYVATAGDCVACHTVGKNKSFSGGYALETPFGKIVSSNITQDARTGIGGWSEQEFIRAVRQGKGKHGENLYPAMPYNAYVKISDADMHDLWAYMRTVAPVSNQVESNQLPFPFNIRLLMSGWNLFFFDDTPFRGDSTQSLEWNRGAYLVDGLGHCAACHTAKNFLGGDAGGKGLQGGLLAGWYAPDITGTQHGIGAWSVQQTVEYLQTGGNAITVASGPMGEAVFNSTQHMSAADLRAIAVYLKSRPGAADARTAPVDSADRQMVLGAKVYGINCAACHAASGRGIPGMATALAGNSAMQAQADNNLVNAVLRGTRGIATTASPTGAAMPSFAWKLTDAQIAAALTYARNSWGNAAPAVGASSIAAARKTLALPGQSNFAPARK